MSYAHEQDKIEKRWPAAVAFIRERGLNEFFGAKRADVGIVCRAACTTGSSARCSGSGSPTPSATRRCRSTAERHLSAGARGVRAPSARARTRPGDRGRPARLHRAGDRRDPAPRRRQTRMHGKDVLPMAGEYTGQVDAAAGSKFLAPPDLAPALLAAIATARRTAPAGRALSGARVPPRPPGFCTGCPERPVFAAMKLVERSSAAPRLGRHRLPHLLDLPPFNIGAHGGLRPRPGLQLGAAGDAAGARDLDHGRRRLLAQRAHFGRRERRVQQGRRRPRHHEERLHLRDRHAGVVLALAREHKARRPCRSTER
jgi:indolepyruvate ferredoxin oxidoreductase, alpha subunit